MTKEARRYFIVDVSNIACDNRDGPSYRFALSMIQELQKGIPEAQIIQIADANLPHLVAKSEKAEIQSARKCGDLKLVPAGSTADPLILSWAEKLDAVVVSNDSYRQYRGMHPWVQRPGRLLGAIHEGAAGWAFLWRTLDPDLRGTTDVSSELLEMDKSDPGIGTGSNTPSDIVTADSIPAPAEPLTKITDIQHLWTKDFDKAEYRAHTLEPVSGRYGKYDRTILVETETGVAGLDIADGRQLWAEESEYGYYYHDGEQEPDYYFPVKVAARHGLILCWNDMGCSIYSAITGAQLFWADEINEACYRRMRKQRGRHDPDPVKGIAIIAPNVILANDRDLAVDAWMLCV